MNLATIFDSLKPQADAAAVSAANAALDSAAARPFSVVLSVSPETQSWIMLMLLGLAVAGAVVKLIK